MSLRIASASTRSAVKLGANPLPLVQRRFFWPASFNSPEVINKKYPDYPKLTEAEDPGMNGGYINPPAIKRQFRDPYGDWWDKQERRNFGEPVHEDNDLLGMMSPYEYTWASTRKAAVLFTCFAATLLSGIGLVYLVYPDQKSYPREFEDGLERELGGAGAWRARKVGDADP
ncbi:uncharacterized protein DNG_00127 [Cephalotrichum gorgonifer]|uniref:Uncharacterized protein n=1 Tax=Cephalotrichum gorgonifer TaxID=2041049 RepID=A0AAE8MQ21_9PEZI|nr:uncharacterized protein DNG_00127 [Cephalotrichum gorgonifer]